MSKNSYVTAPKNSYDEAHVWYCLPDEINGSDHLESLQSLLSEEELQQLDRFHYEKDRHTYLVAHVMLRKVLSMYADLSPQHWQFVKGEHGKPEIKQATSGRRLRFNITHTEGLCACVVSYDIDCGIDAEMVERRNNLSKIAEKMFASSELEALQKFDQADYRKAFFRYWTLRESYVKALGSGIGATSKDFYFIIDDDKITIRQKAVNAAEVNHESGWQFLFFEPTDQHISTIALKITENRYLPVSFNKIDL